MKSDMSRVIDPRSAVLSKAPSAVIVTGAIPGTVIRIFIDMCIVSTLLVVSAALATGSTENVSLEHAAASGTTTKSSNRLRRFITSSFPAVVTSSP